MMKIAPEYSEQYLQIERPKPLSDYRIEQTIQEILRGGWDHDITDQIYTDFKQECESWILG